MASILVPVFYLTLIFGGLFLFSYFYRKRTAGKGYEPWFKSHPERNVYVTLLQQSDPPASDALLKAALIRRAMADVKRVIQLKEDKPALQSLLQKGSIGDDLWNSCLAAEKEMEAEIVEVMHEANTFVQGWGQIIFPTAGEMVNNEKIRGMFEEIPKIKVKQEAKYRKKPKAIDSTEKATSKPAPSPATPINPPTPATPMAPGVPATPSTNGNGLEVPPTADGESIVSSDGEPATPSTPSKSGRTKSSSKKARKRK